jgi:hypothetical protein
VNRKCHFTADRKPRNSGGQPISTGGRGLTNKEKRNFVLITI